MNRAALLLVVLGGCRSASNSTSAGADRATAAPAASDPPPAPAPAPAPIARSQVSADALAEVLPAQPGMPIPLAALHPGDRYEQAAKIFAPAPDGSLHLEVGGLEVAVSIVLAGGSSADGEREVKSVSSGDVLLPAADALALVTARWGPPTTLGGQPWWFNPAAGLRATITDNQVGIDERRLEVHGYATLERMLGDATDRFGFEPRPLLGMPSADASALLPVTSMADPPSGDDDFFTAELPPLETSSEPTIVMFRVAEGKISAIEVPVPDELWDRAVAIAAKKGPHFRADADQRRLIEGAE